MSRFLSVPKKIVWGTLMVLLTVAALSAQEETPEGTESPAEAPKFSFGMFASLGNETLDGANYQYLGLLPDFGYGPWGVGIDLSFHFRFYEKPDGEFGFYPRAKDWWDSDAGLRKNVDKYLARLAYLRYGKKGDPIYAQLGWIPSTTFGTGFIVSGYNNGALRPAIKLTGLNLDLSGSLIDVPWIGLESFVGSLSTFDLFGARFSAKPLSLLYPENPILKDTQFGITSVVDTNPYSTDLTGATKTSGTVVVTGLDAMAPLYASDVVTTVATLDVTAQGAHAGAALGVGGTLVKVISWGFQVRALGDNFLTNYFDQGYEHSRVKKFLVYNGTTKVPGTAGWLANLGTNLLGDALLFGVSFSAPFVSSDNVLTQPQLVGYATLKPGLLPIDANAFYLKRGVTSLGKLLSPEDALIGAKVGYTFGVVTLSVIYDLHYSEVVTDGNRWVSTSRVETSVKMF